MCGDLFRTVLALVFICYSGCIINDNYCDTFDGSDETSTSACSHLQRNNRFPCSSDANSSAGYLNISIPFSRVGDGVCDCCDGSDENGFLIPHQCNNTCDQTLEIIRREAMVAYVKAKNGKEQRNTISERVNRKRIQDERTLAQFIENIEWVKLATGFSELYEAEEGRDEYRQQLKLIRDRLSNCSSGVVEACDIFGENLPPGVVSSSVSALNSRLIVSGYPVQDEDLLREYTSKLGTKERIFSVTCHAKENIVPSTKKRTFTNFGDYFTFMSGAGGLAYRKWSHEQMKKEVTLLGNFLEHGQYGYRHGLVFLCECLGILCSPVILPLQMLYIYLIQPKSIELWGSILQCDSDNSTCYDFTKYIAKIVKESQDEESQTSQYLSYLDYRQYPILSTVYVSTRRLLSYPIWILNIAWETPLLYLRYHFTDARNKLPPKNQNCILRNSIKALREERIVLEKRKKELSEKLVNWMYADESSPDASESKEQYRRRRQKAGDKSTAKPRPIDYGLDRAWLSLQNICVNKTVSGYQYNFCFFKFIEQDSVLIGRYVDWGNRDTIVKDPKPPSYLTEITNYFMAILPDGLRPVKIAKKVDYSVQTYDGGDKCANGQERSADVHYVCTDDAEAPFILSAVETEICTYRFEVATPLACTTDLEIAALNRVKELGVFGYSDTKKLKSRHSAATNQANGIKSSSGIKNSEEL